MSALRDARLLREELELEAFLVQPAARLALLQELSEQLLVLAVQREVAAVLRLRLFFARGVRQARLRTPGVFRACGRGVFGLGQVVWLLEAEDFQVLLEELEVLADVVVGHPDLCEASAP